MKHTKQGFTLIELLVVIAIIAILAAILFPVFAKAREKARQTTCVSNEKQIGLALLQYVQDYDELAPLFESGGTPPAGWAATDTLATGPTSTNLTWMDMAYPYIKSTQVFTCPDDTGAKSQYVPATANTGSYTANLGYIGDDGPYMTANGLPGHPTVHPPWSVPPGGTGLWTQYMGDVSFSKIGSPATTVWVGETGNFGAVTQRAVAPWAMVMLQGIHVVTNDGPYNYICSNDNGSGCQAASYGTLVERHTNQTNVLWCDGHVKSIALTNLLTPGSDGVVMQYFTDEADPN